MDIQALIKSAGDRFRRLTEEYSPRTKRGRLLARLLKYLVIFLVLYIIVNNLVMPIITRHGSEFPLPKIIGMTVPDAKPVLAEAKLGIDITSQEYHADKPSGTILSQFPVAGTMVKSGRTIRVVISLGQKDVPVPDVHGFSVRQASLNLEGSGFTVGQIQWTSVDSLPEKVVVFSYPAAGTMVSYGSAINLMVNRGMSQQTVLVPKLVGLSLTDATKKLEDAGLKVGLVTRTVDENYLPETVLTQSEEPGAELLPGEAVDLTVSNTD